MATHKPIKLDQNELQRFQTGDSIGIEHGGTGANTAPAARAALGLEIGVDVQEHAPNLDVLGGWTQAGILINTGTGWTAREIATASPTRITVTNGDGVTGNPVIDLASVTTATTLGFYKFSYDQYGRVTGSEAVTGSDLTGILNGTYLPMQGGTLTGALTLHADPSAAMQAATKQYVDNLFSSGGIPPFGSVVAKTTGNINIASPGATHDGVTLISGDRILVASQTDAVQNGIYVFNGATSALTRAPDADESSEFAPARQVFVHSGDDFANTGWGVGNSTQPEVGSDPIIFTQVSGAASYTAGNGLGQNGNQFYAVGVSGQIVVSGSGIGLAPTGVTAGTYTKVTVDESGRVTTATQAVPADIGAQPLDSTLTALADFNTNGFVVQTSPDTFAGRTITGTSGKITVTNGNGVAGDPVIDLAPSGVTPGTYNSVTVDESGRVTSGTTSPSNAVSENMENGTTSSVPPGRAVYINGDGIFGLALANNIATAKVIGITQTAIAASADGPVIVDGIVELTTGQWDAVTAQSGGLTPGAEYYLSNVTGGALTTSAPTTGIHAPIGVAVSSTKLKVDVKRVVIL